MVHYLGFEFWRADGQRLHSALRLRMVVAKAAPAFSVSPVLLSPEAKRKVVEQALEYAIDAAIISRPTDLLGFVTERLRVTYVGWRW